MDRIDEGVQQADGDAFYFFLADQRDQCVDGGLIERAHDPAGVVQSFRHRQAEVARDEGLGQHDVQVVLVVTAFVAHREDVAKTLGGDEGGAGALALDDGVGRQGGAVDDQSDVGGCDAGGLGDGAKTVQHALFGCGLGGQHLGGGACAALLEGEVGEGAADIDGKAGWFMELIDPLAGRGTEGWAWAGETRVL